jgi:hypothetical protein
MDEGGIFVGYLTMLSVSQVIQIRMAGKLVNNELGKDVEGSGSGVNEVPSQYFLGKAEKSHEKPNSV